MAQADQVVQNTTFPATRTDINDNLAALFSQSSGNSEPTTKVAFQPWIDTSASPPLWKIRNSTNTAWITVGTLDATFSVGGLTAIANGGTGATTAVAALAALLPSQTGNSGKALTTNGTSASWGTIAVGASIQVFTSSGTYTPTGGKTSFLVFCTGGGGGGGGGSGGSTIGGVGGGGGTALRLYTSTELGSTAAVTVGTGGAGGSYNGGGSTGGSSSVAPTGSGLTISGLGGAGGGGGNGVGGNGGGDTNSLFSIAGGSGSYSGFTFWSAGRGRGGSGGSGINSGTAGTAGVVLILEW